jgi:putative acetyltransferase
LLIREETERDHDAIREVNRLAFGGDVESRLGDDLRAGGLVIASLVAVESDQVVGHILFSDLPIETGGEKIPAASLAPMAVRPEFQRRGIGSALVQAGLVACRTRGKAAVIVLGHESYYPRFGFSAQLGKQIACPFPGAGDAWMALELTPLALANVSGRVRYPDAFGVSAQSSP